MGVHAQTSTQSPFPRNFIPSVQGQVSLPSGHRTPSRTPVQPSKAQHLRPPVRIPFSFPSRDMHRTERSGGGNLLIVVTETLAGIAAYQQHHLILWSVVALHTVVNVRQETTARQAL